MRFQPEARGKTLVALVAVALVVSDNFCGRRIWDRLRRPMLRFKDKPERNRKAHF